MAVLPFDCEGIPVFVFFFLSLTGVSRYAAARTKFGENKTFWLYLFLHEQIEDPSEEKNRTETCCIIGQTLPLINDFSAAFAKGRGSSVNFPPYLFLLFLDKHVK